MKASKLIAIGLSLTIVAFLFLENYKLKKEISQLRSHALSNSAEISQTMMMLHTFVEMAPIEMERIARKAAREEKNDN